MRKAYPVVVIALAIIASLVAFTQMPDRVPIHFDMKGEVDRYASRIFAVSLTPPLIFLIWMFMRVLPRLDPKRANFPKFEESYDLVVNATLTLMLLVHFMMLAASLGMPIFDALRLLPAAVGVLIAIIGNVLPRTRPNWIFGLRTSWTVNNDRVWERTHRMGGYMVTGAGLVIVAGAFLPMPYSLIVLVASLMIASVAGLAYSYLVWKDETRGNTGAA